MTNSTTYRINFRFRNKMTIELHCLTYAYICIVINYKKQVHGREKGK